MEVAGQADVGIVGVPGRTPFSVDCPTNPVLAAWTGLAAGFGAHTGTPLVREGGALIVFHPLGSEFSPLFHPSYVDFFAEVLSATTDPAQISADFEKKFATDPWYAHLYRTSHAFHGLHPVHRWYEIARATRGVGGRGLGRGGPGERGAPRLPGRVHPGRRARDRVVLGRPVAADHLPAHAAPGRGGRRVTELTMSRELAPWAADGGKRRPPGRLADAVGDLRILAYRLALGPGRRRGQGRRGTAVGTVKGDQDAPPIPTAWARTPFLVAVRDLAQTGVLRPVLKAEVNLESHGTEGLSRTDPARVCWSPTTPPTSTSAPCWRRCPRPGGIAPRWR